MIDPRIARVAVERERATEPVPDLATALSGFVAEMSMNQRTLIAEHERTRARVVRSLLLVGERPRGKAPRGSGWDGVA